MKPNDYYNKTLKSLLGCDEVVSSYPCQTSKTPQTIAKVVYKKGGLILAPFNVYIIEENGDIIGFIDDSVLDMYHKK